MTLPALRPDIAIADFDTELVVLVPDRRRAHLLEPLWAVLLDSCRRGDPLERVVADVVAATGWDAAATQRWLDEALESLTASGVLAAP